jgi:16S rRNA (guanine527-N7)-methyltransferase
LAREIPDLHREALETYLAEIIRWNPQLGLVSKRSTGASLQRLVRQSAELWAFVSGQLDGSHSTRVRVVDIGSGAGFPGVVWKLLRPQIAVAVVERRQKKLLFLERVRSILHLEGFEILAGDARELVKRQAVYGTFDIAVTMSVNAPAVIASTIEGFLKGCGLYCTVRPKEEEPPIRIGRYLELARTWAAHCGRFCLYRMQSERRE